MHMRWRVAVGLPSWAAGCPRGRLLAFLLLARRFAPVCRNFRSPLGADLGCARKAAAEIITSTLPQHLWRMATLICVLCANAELKTPQLDLADPDEFAKALVDASPVLGTARSFWRSRGDVGLFVLLRPSYISGLTQVPCPPGGTLTSRLPP